MRRLIVAFFALSVVMPAFTSCDVSVPGTGESKDRKTAVVTDGTIVVNTTVGGNPGTPGMDIGVTITGTENFNLVTAAGELTQVALAGTYTVTCQDVPGYNVAGSMTDLSLSAGGTLDITCAYSVETGTLNVSTTVGGSAGTPGQQIQVSLTGAGNYSLTTVNGALTQVINAGTYTVHARAFRATMWPEAGPALSLPMPACSMSPAHIHFRPAPSA